MWLNGTALTDTDAYGTVLTDDTFLILFNASWNPQVFTLPPPSMGSNWAPTLDTTQSTGSPASAEPVLQANSTQSLEARSLLLLRRVE